MKRFIIIVLVMLLLTTTSLSIFAEQNDLQTVVQNMKPLDLKMSVELPSKVWQYAIVQFWIDKVEEITEGKIKITAYTDQSLITAGNTYGGVIDGIIDIGESDPAYNTTIFPSLGAYYLPIYKWDNTYSACFTWDDFIKQPNKELKNIKMLFGFAMPESCLISTKKVTKLEDLKGMQVRVTGFDAGKVAMLGGSPVAMTAPEVYDALIKGTVDATMMNPTTLQAPFNFQEVAKYMIILPGLSTLPHFCYMSLEAWESIPPIVQDAIERINIETVEYAAMLNTQEVEKSIAEAEATGNVEIYEIDPAELERWYKVLEPLAQQWVDDVASKGVDGNKIIELLTQLTKKYNDIY